MKEADAVCNSKGPYSLVLLDANTDGKNWPGVSFIRRCHGAMGEGHRTNLKRFFVVHASMRTKALAFFMQALEPRVWGRVEYLETLQELFAHVPRQHMHVPEHVLQRDRERGAGGASRRSIA